MKLFPVQSSIDRSPAPRSIPWQLAEQAYTAYAAMCGSRQSLETLARRHGFTPEELDCLLGGCDPFEWSRHTPDEKVALRAAWAQEATA